MKYVFRSEIYGEIIAPKSKSIQQRVLIADFLSDRNISYELYNDDCDDVKHCKGALNVLLRDNIMPFFGDSGFCFRVLPIISSVFKDENSFLISNQLINRPIKNLLEILGLEAEFENAGDDKFILNVKGKLLPKKYIINTEVTSQILSGLLMALPLLKSDSELILTNLSSKPYIDLTNEILKNYSIEINRVDEKTFYIKGNQTYSRINYFDEGDWSGSAFLISAAAICSDLGVKINGLNHNSVQADRAILKILELADCNYKFENSILSVSKSDIKSFDFDFDDCPDLVPAIIPICINSNGICKIKNVNRLKYKESNRVKTLIETYSKVGINIQYSDNNLIVYPGKVNFAEIEPASDHRIAMSLAIAALNSENYISISDSNCVNKSYTKFWDNLIQLGAKIK